MIEITKNELRLDEVVLRNATTEEVMQLGQIAKAIIERARKQERTAG